MFARRATLWFTAAIGLLAIAACSNADDPGAPGADTPSASATAGLKSTLGQLPLHFEVNTGQSDPRVEFLSRAPGYTLYLTSEEAILNLADSNSSAQPLSLLRIRPVGASANPHLTGLDSLSGKINYFMGSDPEQWRTDIPTYGRVRYQDVYPQN